MRFVLICVLALSLSGCASWDFNKALWATSSALITLDWAQTRYIATHSNKFHEHNILIGSAPTLAKVDTYFASYLLVNTAMLFILPDAWQPYWYSGVSGIEAYGTISNVYRGIGTDFGLRN